MVHRLRTALVVTIVAIVVVAVVGVLLQPGKPMRNLTAEFAEAPGVYPGNHVDMLGIPIGTVTKITPEPSGVAVRMRIDANVPLPAGVNAELMAPEVVSDRYIALTPAYTRGPRLAPGAVIGLSHTAAPVSVDQVLGTLNQLVTALGPQGANEKGALQGLLAQLAKVLGNEGPNIKRSVTNLGQALGAISQDGPQITGLLNHLGHLSKAAASDSGSYQAFARDLAAVSTELASDNHAIAGALHNLQTGLGQLTQFVAANRDTLGASAQNLENFAATLAHEQKALAETLTLSPLALQNVTNTVDTQAPGGPAVRVRYDGTPATTGLTGPVCGNTLLRLLVVTTGQSHPTPLDLLCGFSAAVESLGTAPGTSSGPNLSLSALVGGRA